MNIKKFVLATLAGGAAMWLTAGAWHMWIMRHFYAVGHGAHHSGTGYIAVAYLVLGLLMAYMYPIGYKGGKPLFEGLRFGVLIGLVWVLPHTLAMLGAHGGSLWRVLINAAWHVIEQGIGGIIVGLIYGRAVMERARG
jgi:hypothetical protein